MTKSIRNRQKSRLRWIAGMAAGVLAALSLPGLARAEDQKV